MSKEEQYQKLCEINRVESFDPAAFAVEYTDMNTGEVRKRLPVMIQMAWFRLKYPEGRIAVEVTPAKDCFVAKARVYPNYQDGPECYLAEATASRGPDPAHPTVSPREWAQTAAVGVALFWQPRVLAGIPAWFLKHPWALAALAASLALAWFFVFWPERKKG